MYMLTFFLYFYTYSSKNHQRDQIGSKIFYFQVSYLLLKAIICDTPSFFDPKSHCYWLKLDFISISFFVYVFVEFKIVLGANKYTIWLLAFDLKYGWYYHFFELFLQKVIENQKTKVVKESNSIYSSSG